jgi:hypothetical protein
MAEQLEFCVWLGKNGSETLQFIHQAYAEDDAMRQAAVFKWWKHFRDREMNMKDDNCLLHYPPEACSMFLRSEWSIVKVHCLLREVIQKRDCYCTSTKF